MQLHGYFRSSASYRVRIALNLKKLTVEHISHHLRRGEQRDPEYLLINPQGLVPALKLEDGRVLTQSLSIIEWLDETHPNPPLLPRRPEDRAEVRAFAQVIACDTHPIQNLKILQRLGSLGISEDAANTWAREANNEGLQTCEMLAWHQRGPFCFGQAPSLADICLIPAASQCPPV